MKKGKSGLVFVLACYVMWGMLTIFWNLLSEVSSLYILAQRIFWSMIFMGGFLVVTGKTEEVKAVLRSREICKNCLISGILVTINWGVYILAVSNGHVLDASMGYFIEPIVVALIGVLIFKERLSKFEIVTFLFAAVGVLYLIVRSGTVPVMALLIAISFAAYGAVKKNLTLTAHTSLFMETLFMSPFAILFIVYSEMTGTGCLNILHGSELLLLPICGVVTSVPLLLFNIGVKEIPYYLSGILMYINPTIQFFVGLLYFHENLDTNRLTAFVFIWVGVLFTLYEKLMIMKREKKGRGMR